MKVDVLVERCRMVWEQQTVTVEVGGPDFNEDDLAEALSVDSREWAEVASDSNGWEILDWAVVPKDEKEE